MYSTYFPCTLHLCNGQPPLKVVVSMLCKNLQSKRIRGSFHIFMAGCAFMMTLIFLRELYLQTTSCSSRYDNSSTLDTVRALRRLIRRPQLPGLSTDLMLASLHVVGITCQSCSLRPKKGGCQIHMAGPLGCQWRHQPD